MQVISVNEANALGTSTFLNLYFEDESSDGARLNAAAYQLGAPEANGCCI